MKKNWGNMRDNTGKWGKLEKKLLSCPPWSERLATAMIMRGPSEVKGNSKYDI